MNTITVFKETSDEWFGTFFTESGGPIQLVRISLLKLLRGFRVLASGTDDFALEMDFNTESEARQMLNQIIAEPDVTRAYLKGLGFTC